MATDTPKPQAARYLGAVIDMLVAERVPLHEAVTIFRRAYVETAVAVNRGNRTHAARTIHVGRTTIQRNLAKP